MKKDGVGKRIRNLKTKDLMKEQFESAKALTSGSLIAHEIHNLNDTRIVNHIKRNKAMKDIALQRNKLQTKISLKRIIIKFKIVKEQKGYDIESFTGRELKIYI